MCIRDRNQYVLPVPAINFLLIGMAFSTVFANMISEKQLAEIMKVMDPVIGIDVYKRQNNGSAPFLHAPVGRQSEFRWNTAKSAYL